MIDDKKIEEGSKKFRQYFHENGDRTQGFLVQFGFEAGAKWAINEFLKNLWHSIEEEPDKRKSDIITIGSYNFISLHFKESFIWKDESWRHSISRCQITKWAYLSDILPKQKGGNND